MDQDNGILNVFLNDLRFKHFSESYRASWEPRPWNIQTSFVGKAQGNESIRHNSYLEWERSFRGLF